jgi:hypothetical protein
MFGRNCADPRAVAVDHRFHVNQSKPHHRGRQEERRRAADPIGEAWDVRRTADPRLRFADLVIERDRQVTIAVGFGGCVRDEIEQQPGCIGRRGQSARGGRIGRDIAGDARERRRHLREFAGDVGFDPR